MLNWREWKTYWKQIAIREEIDIPLRTDSSASILPLFASCVVVLRENNSYTSEMVSFHFLP